MVPACRSPVFFFVVGCRPQPRTALLRPFLRMAAGYEDRKTHI
ncbi:hypothetical protein STXM2123_736 [Streptomyces sp. F-3]|nr:hypothetical protein STXM2123_736 [Streptomyces sp. F-3]